MPRDLRKALVVDGYQSARSPLAVRPGAIIQGSTNILFGGDGKSFAYKGVLPISSVAGGRAMFNSPGGGYASLGTAASIGKGSIVGLIGRAMGIIGAGGVYINGIDRSISASTALQILLYRAGLYTGAGTGPYTAGLDRTAAPTLATTPTASTIMSGTYSAVIWFVRSATGGRSRKSTMSAVIVNDAKKMRLTVAGADLTYAASAGADRIGIGVTAAGFGATGPHYELQEIAISSLTTVDGVANSVELEWSSAELTGKDLAPIDDFTPPPAVFAVAIEDALALIGAYGDLTSGVSATNPGTAIAVSLPVFIESFPPDNLLFLPEIPIGVLPPSDGVAFIGCKNSMHALRYTGGNPPMSLQPVWQGTGIASQHNMFLGEGGRLYAFSNGKQGLVRIGVDNEPETAWASDVAEETRGWVAENVIGGWDNDHQLAVFGHGKWLLAYNSQINRWCAPLDMTGALEANEVLCACVTVGGALLLAVRDTVNTANPIKLFNFNAGTGTTYEVVLPWQSSDLIADTLTQLDVAIRTDNVTYPVNLKVYRNGDRVTPKATRTITLPATGQQHLQTQRINVRNAKSHTVYVSQRSAGGSDVGVDLVTVRGDSSGVAI